MSEADPFTEYYLRYLPHLGYGARKNRLYTKTHLTYLVADLRLASHNYREVVRLWRLRQLGRNQGESE